MLQKRFSFNFPISVKKWYFLRSIEKILWYLVLVNHWANGSINEDGILNIKIDINWFHIQFSCVIEHDFGSKLGSVSFRTDNCKTRPLYFFTTALCWRVLSRMVLLYEAILRSRAYDQSFASHGKISCSSRVAASLAKKPS